MDRDGIYRRETVKHGLLVGKPLVTETFSAALTLDTHGARTTMVYLHTRSVDKQEGRLELVHIFCPVPTPNVFLSDLLTCIPQAYHITCAVWELEVLIRIRPC